MKIVIPEHSVLGVYIDGSVIAVIKDPTIDKILLAATEERAGESTILKNPIEDTIALGWTDKFDLEVKYDHEESDEDDYNNGTIELMPIVIY